MLPGAKCFWWGSGGGGGNCSGIGVSCSTNSECCSGRCSASRGICVNEPSSGVECTGPINCPAGTIRGSTLIGSQCESYQCTGNVGSAQQTGSCCDFYTPPRVCGPWYDCPTPSNPNKQCRDCEQEPGWCQKYNYEQYNCVSVCASTAPTNVTFTPISLTAARLTWTPGTGGTTQYVYVGSNKSDVEANCAGGTCAVSVNLGSATQSTYDTPQVLVPGTVYYYRVVNSESISCATPSVTGTHLQSCTLSPTSLSLSTSQTAVITASVGNSSEIQRVDFSSNNPSIASVAPSSDNSYPYTATVTANTTGSATITATVYYTGGGVACQTGSGSFPGSQNTNVTVANLSAWWQVRDGDVTASVTELGCALG
ncbi:MAG: Ig-like domain-containing protein [Chloroflexota bacterium]